MIMQAAFFKLANVIPIDDAVKYLKDAIKNTYGRKGENIVKMNYDAVDRGMDALVKVKVPAEWKDIRDEAAAASNHELPAFIKDILIPMNRQEGDRLRFQPLRTWLTAHSQAVLQHTKRGIALYVPGQPETASSATSALLSVLMQPSGLSCFQTKNAKRRLNPCRPNRLQASRWPDITTGFRFPRWTAQAAATAPISARRKTKLW